MMYAILKIELEFYDPVIDNIECIHVYDTLFKAERQLQYILELRKNRLLKRQNDTIEYINQKGIKNLSQYDIYRTGINAGNINYIACEIIKRNGTKDYKPINIPDLYSNYHIVEIPTERSEDE